MPAARACWPKASDDELAALIGVPDQSGRRAALRERHLQRVGDELGAHVIGHASSRRSGATEDVLDGDQVQPALPGPQVGDVGDPQPVGRRGEERAVDEVLADPHTGHPDRCLAALASDQPRQAGLAHQALHALAPDPLAVAEHAARRGCAASHRRRGSSAWISRMRSISRSSSTRARRRPTALPGVKARAADAEHAAHRLDRVLGLLRRDEPEDHRRVSLSFGEEGRRFSQDLALLGRGPGSRGAAGAAPRARRRSGPRPCPRRRRAGATSCAATAASIRAPRRAAAPTGRSSSAGGPPRGGTPSEYGGVDGMDIDPCCRARRPSDQVSTKPGELHTAPRDRHPRTLSPAHTRLHRQATRRRQEHPRSDPLPQALPRPPRLAPPTTAQPRNRTPTPITFLT